MKTLRSILLAASAVLAISSAQATTVIAPTFDELVARAQLIFQGRVTDVQSQWTGEGGQRHIVTYVTFAVEEALKGEVGASYTLRMLGGTVGDQTMEVTDSPKFKVGSRDIVFVENNGSQFIPLVGIMHGRFRVQTDAQTGVDVVTNDHGRPVGDVAALGREQSAVGEIATNRSTPPSERALGVSDFKAAIRAQLNAQR